MVRNYITFQLYCHQFPNVHFPQYDVTFGACVMYSVNKKEFNGELCNCTLFTLILVMLSILCAKFMYTFCSLQLLMHVQLCAVVESLTTKHVISMAAR